MKQTANSAEIKQREFWPETVYVSPESADDDMTKRILSRLGKVNTIHSVESGDPLRAKIDSISESQIFTEGKRLLQLSRYKGEWLKSCPGTSQHVCCNLWIVNPGEGCPLDCTYCYLQSYLKRNPTLKIYTNVADMLQAIENKAQENPGRLFRIGTGEVFDSLVWDELTELSAELVPLFARVPNLVLELKSKFDYVDNLLALKDKHNGKTVVSWSVNAKSVTENDEAFTASLERRIVAAEKVVDAGYRVGFHFDPVIHFEGWQDEYRDTIQRIFSRIAPAKVAWVSVSTLRYKGEMQQIMQERFPRSKIPFGEQFLAKDRKLRYLQPIRFQLIDFIWKELKAIDSQMPTYMCMESAAAWHNIAQTTPTAGSELVEIFSRKGRVPVSEPQSTIGS